MKELGKKSETFGNDLLKPVNLFKRPTEMPKLGEGERVICGYDQGLGERMIVCDSLADMQTLYDAGIVNGGALRVKWYTAPDPGRITVPPANTIGLGCFSAAPVQ
jgi:hypothetical protein